MNLIGDENRYYCIIGILTFVSCLSHSYHHSFLVPCVCSTVIYAILCLLLRPQRFVVDGSVYCTCPRVCATLYKLVPIIRRVFNEVTSQQVPARRKHSVASE